MHCVRERKCILLNVALYWKERWHVFCFWVVLCEHATKRFEMILRLCTCNLCVVFWWHILFGHIFFFLLWRVFKEIFVLRSQECISVAGIVSHTCITEVFSHSVVNLWAYIFHYKRSLALDSILRPKIQLAWQPTFSMEGEKSSLGISLFHSSICILLGIDSYPVTQ